MRLFLPLGREPGGPGEEQGTYVYVVKGKEVRVFTSNDVWGFPVGDETSSAYSVEDLEDPNLFREVQL